MRKSILSRFTDDEVALALALAPDRWRCECGAVPNSVPGRTPCVPADEPLPTRLNADGEPMVAPNGATLTTGHHTRTDEQVARRDDRALFEGLVMATDVMDKVAAIKETLKEK